MRVAIGELFQETCAFSPVTTTEREFDVTPSSDLVGSFADTESELGGMLAVLDDADADAEVDPLPSIRMVPGAGGPVEESVFETYLERLVAPLRTSQPDAVLLVLHGSMMTTERSDPEGELLRRIRNAVGDVPLVASLDHHAHLTRRMVDTLDGAIAYTTHPHTDVRETGERAARLLFDVARPAVDPYVSMVKAPMTSATRTETDRSPLREVFALRRELETTNEDALAVSFLPVHPWLDVPNLGFTGVAVTNADPALADDIATRLATRVWERRESFSETYPSVPEAVDIAAGPTETPVVLSDRGDITLGGAPGDSPAILRELLAHEESADVSAVIPIVDPGATEALATAEGDRISRPIGGTLTPAFEPVAVDAVVESVHDGPVTQEGTYYAGTSLDAGLRVVLRIEDAPVHVILSSQPPLTTAPSFFSAHGVDPTERALVVVKSAGHFRPNFEPVSGRILTVDSPGVCPIDLEKCPYEVARPLYPVDETSFEPSPYGSW